MEAVSFDNLDNIGDGTRVSMLCISGEVIDAVVRADGTILGLKQAVGSRLQLSLFDFHLCVISDDAPAKDSMLVSSCTADDFHSSKEASTGRRVTMSLVKSILTLQRFEEKSEDEWREIASQLQCESVDDETMLACLRIFLDKYPALINWQWSLSDVPDNDPNSFRSLLGFAVEKCSSCQLRQRSVDELLERGARVHIRHHHGFLIDLAKASGSAFVDYLEQKAKEFRLHEKASLVAWRDVSSKLCGETRRVVSDEDSMAQIVSDFCIKYPEMVNFQNNHAVDERTDEPYGYFGYAPLLPFAGVSGDTRKISVDVLLQHGARIDMQHGGATSMEWLRRERSELRERLQEVLAMPAPPQASFKFNRETSDMGTRSGRKCCIQ
jgi:hypothetical protein